MQTGEPQEKAKSQAAGPWRVTGLPTPPETLEPASALLLLCCHLLGQPGIHGLLCARDQGPDSGADRVLLPDWAPLLSAVGGRAEPAPPG